MFSDKEITAFKSLTAPKDLQIQAAAKPRYLTKIAGAVAALVLISAVLLSFPNHMQIAIGGTDLHPGDTAAVQTAAKTAIASDMICVNVQTDLPDETTVTAKSGEFYLNGVSYESAVLQKGSADLEWVPVSAESSLTFACGEETWVLTLKQNQEGEYFIACEQQ
ncbi:MAG: hypothetical protein IIX77_03550 [Oscillospiraceae bacterium]|nr:hypothetical protein [Oscillospiraceae bacterium]